MESKDSLSNLLLKFQREVEACDMIIHSQILFANPADKEAILCGLTQEEFEKRLNVRLVFREDVEHGKMLLAGRDMLNTEPPMFDESRRMIYDS